MTSTEEGVPRLLQDLYAAERKVRELHARIAEMEPAAQLAALAPAVAEALSLADDEEAELRLVRASALLAELEGPKAADLLIDVLGAESLEARRAAGEGLEDLAFDRFKELALAVERALERLPHGHGALTELPFLLCEVPEPGVQRLIGRFLAHHDAEAVAATIEAIVDHADLSAASLLAPLERDARQVEMEDDEGDEGTVTIGELATEARSLLAELAAAGPTVVDATPPGKSAPRGANPARARR
jgi:hypothetical protein